MEIKKVPISEVKVWEKNPRNIKIKDMERLKKQIQELGVYKPLICVQENGSYITLGGNMRLRALKNMGIQEVEISIVEAKSEAEKIKYALSDNDRTGEYMEQELAELVYPHIEKINLKDYKIDLGEPIEIKDIVEGYTPDFLENDNLDKAITPNEYPGHSLPFRLGKILSFITDEELSKKIYILENELLGKKFSDINQKKINDRMTEVLKEGLGK